MNLMLLLLAVTFQGISTGSANTPEPLKISRVQSPPVIDGHVDEPLWNSIESLPLISYEPVAGLPPSEDTEVKIGYDDQFIYVSICAFDSEPDKIRVNSLYRDRLSGDDLFHILLDTYNDNESAIGFTITPLGGQKGCFNFQRR